jgi:hypothetical protein
VVAHEGIGNRIAEEVIRVAERDQLGFAVSHTECFGERFGLLRIGVAIAGVSRLPTP